MRTVSAAFQAKINQNIGEEPINILGVQFGASPSSVRYFADRDVGINIDGKILEISTLNNIIKLEQGSHATAFSVTISDAEGILLGLINLTDIHKKPVTLFQYFNGLVFTDALPIFFGEVSSPVRWDEGERTISFEVISKIEDGEIGFALDSHDQIPSTIPDSAIGKSWPLCFGTVLRVPALKVSSPARGTLRTAIIRKPDVNPNDGLPTQFQVDNAKSFPQAVGPLTPANTTDIIINDIIFRGHFVGDKFTVFQNQVNLPKYTTDDPKFKIEPTLRKEYRAFIGTVGTDDIVQRALPPPLLLGKSGKKSLDNKFEQVFTAYPPWSTFYLKKKDSNNNPIASEDLPKLQGLYLLIKFKDDTDPENIVNRYFITLVIEQFDDLCIHTPQWVPKAMLTNDALGVIIDGTDYTLIEAAGLMRDKWFEAPYIIEADSEKETPEGPADLKMNLLIPRKNDNWIINPGAKVYPVTDQETVYICNLETSTEILEVLAYRQVETGLKVLCPVPSRYYSKELNYNGFFYLTGKQSTALVFKKAPSDREDEGWEDNLYVSLRSSLGNNTVDVINYLAINYSTLTVDSVSFNATQPKLTKFPSNFALLERKNVLNTLEEIAWQARCTVWINSGKLFIRYLSEEPTEVDTINENHIEFKTLSLEFQETETIITKLVAEWQKDYDQESIRRIAHRDHFEKRNVNLRRPLVIQQQHEHKQDSFRFVFKNNVDKYGLNEKTFNFYIYNQLECVQKSATFWGKRYSNSWKHAKFATFLSKFRLEIYDPVKLTLIRPIFANTGIKAEVVQVNFDSGNYTLNFDLWLPVKSGEMTQSSDAWVSDAADVTPDDPGAGLAEQDYVVPRDRHIEVVDLQNTLVIDNKTKRGAALSTMFTVRGTQRSPGENVIALKITGAVAGLDKDDEDKQVYGFLDDIFDLSRRGDTEQTNEDTTIETHIQRLRLVIKNNARIHDVNSKINARMDSLLRIAKERKVSVPIIDFVSEIDGLKDGHLVLLETPYVKGPMTGQDHAKLLIKYDTARTLWRALAPFFGDDTTASEV